MRQGWAVVFLLALCGFSDEPVVRKTMLDAAVRESSGLAASVDHPGTLWTHGDSGTGPILFAVNFDGTVQRQVTLDATNTDWEDIARWPSAQGPDRLLIADIGNNRRTRTQLQIIVLDEPDPAGDGVVTPQRILQLTLPPDVTPFDAEALFVHQDRGYLIEKVLGMQARVYGFDLHTDTQPLTYETTLPIRIPVTGADAADGVLVVSTVAGVYRFDIGEDLTDLAASTPKFARRLDPLMEGVTIVGNEIWASSEQNLLVEFRPAAFEE